MKNSDLKKKLKCIDICKKMGSSFDNKGYNRMIAIEDFEKILKDIDVYEKMASLTFHSKLITDSVFFILFSLGFLVGYLLKINDFITFLSAFLGAIFSMIMILGYIDDSLKINTSIATIFKRRKLKKSLNFKVQDKSNLIDQYQQNIYGIETGVLIDSVKHLITNEEKSKYYKKIKNDFTKELDRRINADKNKLEELKILQKKIEELQESKDLDLERLIREKEEELLIVSQ